MASRLESQSKGQQPVVRVHAHSSPPRSTPRSLPVSPDMIPAFSYGPDIAVNSVDSLVPKKSVKRGSVFQGATKKKESISKNSEFKNTNKEIILKPNTKKRLNLATPDLKIPLNLNKPRNTKTGRSVTLTNLSKDPPKQRRVQSSRDDDRENKGFLKMLSNEFPPYNPSDFVPDESDVDETHNNRVQRNKKSEDDNEELLRKIRRELEEWMVESSEMEKQQLAQCMYSLLIQVSHFLFIK
uniref:Uncharacterized protein n=1 Tax=Graphocephala atropunctata TaxID=36148 RepID=A0A1B6KPX5_9HEMI